MGNGIVEDNYQIRLNYMSLLVMDHHLRLNYTEKERGKGCNRLDFTGNCFVDYERALHINF